MALFGFWVFGRTKYDILDYHLSIIEISGSLENAILLIWRIYCQL